MTTKKKEEKGNKGNKLSERETETARKIEDDIFISIWERKQKKRDSVLLFSTPMNNYS